MPAIDESVPGAWLEEAHQTLPDEKLLRPVEEVEEAAGVDDGDFAAQLVEAIVVRIDHVADDKRSPQVVPVPKQVVANVDKAWLDIGSNESRALDPRDTELAEDLPDAAPQIQEDVSGPGNAQPEDDLLIAGVSTIVQAEELPAAQKGAVGNIPGVLSLS